MVLFFASVLLCGPRYFRGRVDDWGRAELLALDDVESAEGEMPYCADLLSFYFAPCGDWLCFRVGFVSLQSITREPRENLWMSCGVSLGMRIVGAEDEVYVRVFGDGSAQAFDQNGKALRAQALVSFRLDMVEVRVENVFREDEVGSLCFEVESFVLGELCDVLYADAAKRLEPGAHCALMHHGNQGLGYTEAFRGRSDDPDGSGYDEILEAHDAHNIPVNIHMGGLLQTAAAWYDPDFNSWIATGVSEGWICMIASAYSQHIMPFVVDDMNAWSVYIHRQMTHFYYGYWATVAWVPERTFLDGPGGRYPNAGVSDWLGDNFEANDIDAVILDDDVHCAGYDNHQIHFISGTSLRLIPRDHDFTGRLHAGDGAGALAILEGLAASPEGDYRIVVYADDWEMAAEIGEWASTMPNAKETYDWFVNKCWEESSWLHTWKLTDAVLNPDFNGVTLTFTPGSHVSIGGTDGYGGGNNGWYTHWAGYPSPSDNHSPQWDFGTIWYDAYTNLSSAPDNNISQAGWYVLMTNLFETGWHDGMGGPISGWEMKYSTHIKNANVYAEGARWASGEYTQPVGAFFADLDHDGNDELVIYNDRVFAVFESIGGRAVWIFAKDGANNASIVGNCNTYWEGTEGDYNDANHIAALSDVSVGGWDYEHSFYDWEILASCSDSAVIVLRHDQLRKRISVYPGEPYLRCEYFTRDKETYIKAGFTPDLVSLLWGPSVQRIWRLGQYCGFRNANNDAVGAFILGGGGASHSHELSSTLLKGDEIKGKGTFGFYLYCGWQSATPEGYVAAFDDLAASLGDNFPPDAYRAMYNPGTDVLTVTFTEPVDVSVVNLSGIGFDEGADGTVEVWLSPSCVVQNAVDHTRLRIKLSPLKASLVEALSPENLILALAAGAVRDTAGNPCRQLSNGPDQVPITVTGNLSITIDGYLDTTEWASWCNVVDDPDDDSEWDPALNEIWGIYMYWDSLYVYFAIHGIHEAEPNDNAWLLFLDTDYGGTNGCSDLRNIDNWDRNVYFTSESGFKCDYQYGSYRGWTGDFWRILSPTSSERVLGEFWCETDLTSPNPCSELAVSWDELYGLGPGMVPPNTRIALVASIASDIELGGDSAPNNVSAFLPNIDTAAVFVVDNDGDGVPEPISEILSVREGSGAKPALSLSVFPNPFNSVCVVRCAFDDDVGYVLLRVYDVGGRLVRRLFEGEASCGVHTFVWDGTDSQGAVCPSGVYVISLSADGAHTTEEVLVVR